MVNLYKFKANDQNKKRLKFRAHVELQQRQNCIKPKVWGQLGMQLIGIKSQRAKLNFDWIPKLKPWSKKRCHFEKNKKKRKTKWHVVWLMFIFFFFSRKGCSSSYFPGAFNSVFHQIWQNTHQYDGLTFDCTLVWFFLADWHHNHCDAF